MAARLWCRDVRALSRVPLGVPLGAALLGPREAAQLVMFDVDGVLWLIADGTRQELVRWCLASAIRVEPTLGELVRTLMRGESVGLLVELAGQLGVLLSLEVCDET